MGDFNEALRLVERLIDDQLMENLTEKYQVIAPGTNVEAIDSWLAECLRDESCLSRENPNEVFDMTALLASQERLLRGKISALAERKLLIS